MSKKNTKKKNTKKKIEKNEINNNKIEIEDNRKLIIKGHDNNLFVKFWNWGWGIYYKNPEVWNYLIVGGLTTLIALGTKWGLLFTCLDASNALELQIAVVVSWVVAVIFAYVTNRVFVFKSKSKEYFKEIVSFLGGRIATLLMEMFIMWFFVTLLKLDGDIEVFIITLVAQVLVMVGNYFISKLFVFKNKN